MWHHRCAVVMSEIGSYTCAQRFWGEDSCFGNLYEAAWQVELSWADVNFKQASYLYNVWQQLFDNVLSTTYGVQTAAQSRRSKKTRKGHNGTHIYTCVVYCPSWLLTLISECIERCTYGQCVTTLRQLAVVARESAVYRAQGTV